MLESSQKTDIPYMQSMHYDQLAISSRLMGACLGNLKDVDQDLEPVVALMRNWDGKLGVDSPEATIFETTISQAIHLLLEHWLGELGLKIQGRGPFCGQWPEHTWEWFIHLLEKPNSPWFNLGNGETRDDLLRLGLRQAVDYLKRELGPQIANWKWGRLHQLTFSHVLGAQKPLDRVFNIGPFPIGGDGNTIWATFTSWVDHKHKEMVGPPFRFIADLNDLDHCLGQLIPGESGHLASPHFRDGIKPWFTGEYHVMLFQGDEVEKNLKKRLILLPRVTGKV